MGTARLGSLLRAKPARWSGPPKSVTYRWELCARSRCTAIVGATGKTLRVTRGYARHSIRVVVVARFGSTRVTSASARVRVRPRA
jgi:hypothetical protein